MPQTICAIWTSSSSERHLLDEHMSTAYWPSQYLLDDDGRIDRLVFDILERYFWALEDGSITSYHPSMAFDLTDDQVETVVAGVDDEFCKEMERNAGTWKAFDCGPDFGGRLDIEGKRAMVEELRAAVRDNNQQT